MIDLATASDEELVEASRSGPSGNLRAFEHLVERHQGRVLANCRYLTGSPDAEDLAQEVFVKAYFGLSGFEGRASFSTWIQRIKVNHCLNHLSRRRPSWVPLDESGVSSRPELRVPAEADRAVQALDQRRRIAAALGALSEALRVPLVLRDADGYSYQEIADRLGIGLSAVKMRIKRAREEFRRRFDSSEAGALQDDETTAVAAGD
jgi:RNA polymerase sigma-70 factor (ECF subfamily)